MPPVPPPAVGDPAGLGPCDPAGPAPGDPAGPGTGDPAAARGGGRVGGGAGASVVVQVVGAAEVAALGRALVRVYAAAFGAEPYGETRDDAVQAVERLRDDFARRAGFVMVVARVSDGGGDGDGGGDVAGFAYGAAVGRTNGWWQGLHVPAPDAMSREDGARSFGLFELAVHPTHQGRGVAAALHRELVGVPERRGTAVPTSAPAPTPAPMPLRFPHERVLLNVHRRASAARAAYRSWGYHEVGSTTPWPGADEYLMLVLDLAQGPRLRSGAPT